MTYKTENNIWVDVVKIIKQSLTENNITGVIVRQSSQPIKSSSNEPNILIDRISSVRHGFQYGNDVIVGDELIHQEKFIQEIQFQITGLKRRQTDLTDEELLEIMTSSDIINIVVMWLQSKKGIEYIRSLGYTSLRIPAVREPTFTNDSDVYEKSPIFELSLILEQERTISQASIDDIEINMTNI